MRNINQQNVVILDHILGHLISFLYMKKIFLYTEVILLFLELEVFPKVPYEMAMLVLIHQLFSKQNFSILDILPLI